jgi:UDP-glucose 4,6-dehydratase
MNLLVTGGCGFIGSHFINNCWKNNTTSIIVNIDALYYSASELNINEEVRNSNRYHFVHGNLQSLDLVRYILKSFKITHVVHFAAQSHVENSFEQSLQYTKDNIFGTHVLLEACRQHGITKFIHVSTDEVYGESMLDAYEKHHEESILCPTNPYAATKAGAELIVSSYYYSFKMPIIITRGNNVYGKNQYPEKVIPKFIQQLKNGEPVTIQGNGSNIRSFLYIDDVVEAFEIILEKGVIGEIYNIGGDDDYECSVLELAQKLIKNIIGTDDYSKWITFINDRPFNDKRYFISNSKLKSLGWEPKIKLNEGLKLII